MPSLARVRHKSPPCPVIRERNEMCESLFRELKSDTKLSTQNINTKLMLFTFLLSDLSFQSTAKRKQMVPTFTAVIISV